jgi:putative hydrolase of the HAD superfamily
MAPPRVIIFDLDDVLCRYDLGRRLRALSRMSGKLPRDIRAAIWDSGFEDDADSGRYISADDYLYEFGSRLGYPLSRAEWIAARRLSMEPHAEVLKLARHLRATKKILIFTNNGPLLKESLNELLPDAHKIFGEQLYCSYEFASKKPDPASYKRLLDRLGIAPSEGWFIDDKQSNVEGARLMGLQAHRFVSYEGLAKEALRLGLTLP